MATTTCPDCEGLLRAPCGVCQGTGGIEGAHKPCWWCGGLGDFTCATCQGAGAIETEDDDEFEA